MSEEDLQEAYQGDKECPECGEPVEDVRMTCPNCGHEYSNEDYTVKDAGSEFRAGSALKESGEEKEGITGDPDTDAEKGAAGSTSAEEDEEASDDTSSDTSDDTSSDTSSDEG